MPLSPFAELRREVEGMITQLNRADSSMSLEWAQSYLSNFETSAMSFSGRGLPPSYRDRVLLRWANSRGTSISSCQTCAITYPTDLMLRDVQNNSLHCARCVTGHHESNGADWFERSFDSHRQEDYEEEYEEEYDDGEEQLLGAGANPIRELGVPFVLADGETLQPRHRFFGFEIECVVEHTGGNFSNCLKRWPIRTAIAKYDGSLPSGGMEVCTVPMSRLAVIDEMKKICAHLAEYEARAWNRSHCGLHIHVSRESASWGTWGKVERFIQNHSNQTLINKIAGRRPNSFCQRNNIMSEPDLVRMHKLTSPYKKHIEGADRYQAINFSSNKPTVEFRLFRGNTAYKGLMRSMEFCDSLIEWAVTETRESPMNGDKYVSWLSENRGKYPHLAAYLRLSPEETTDEALPLDLAA